MAVTERIPDLLHRAVLLLVLKQHGGFVNDPISQRTDELCSASFDRLGALCRLPQDQNRLSKPARTSGAP